jgi:GxxExxY protein
MQDRKRHDGQDKFSEIKKEILGCCFDVINTLGSGFVESIYRNALVIALNDSGLKVSAERGFEVIFRGRKIGIFVPDVIVEKEVRIQKSTSSSPSCRLRSCKSCSLLKIKTLCAFKKPYHAHLVKKSGICSSSVKNIHSSSELIS